MHFSWPTVHALIKVGGVVLLWLLSVSESFAGAPRVTAKVCDPQTVSIRALIRQARSVGGPVVKRVRGKLLRARLRTAHVERGTRPSVSEDSQAIPNDAPAAHVSAAPVLALRLVGLFADRLERLPFTPSFSPRAPRGPPVLA